MTAPSPSAGAFGLRPQDLHSAYQLPDSAAAAQTVALVDAYNDPTAEADLKAYDEEFGLPECTSGDGCFRQVNQSGEAGNPPFPKTTKELETARRGSRAKREEAEEATGWGLEISLDIEVAHATCQSCDIVLVEADGPSYEDLETAETSAATLGAGEISNSWAGSEEGETPGLESASPFNHPGIVITAAAGDDGYLNWDSESSVERGRANFPASSPHVVAVGGTRLSLGTNSAWAGETVWNGDHATGGGCSAVFTAQPWQQSVPDWSAVGCATKRAIVDVAADADPYTGVAVHDTSPECEYRYEEAGVKHVAYWCTIGGTSLATPLVASVFALAGGADGVAYPAETLYESGLKSSASLHDVTVGSNGECTKPFLEGGLSACTPAEEAVASCASKAICLAGTGYDGPTGVGTPDGIAAFKPLPSSGCTDYWTNTAGGSWYTGADWSTGSPPHAGEGACIVASGTYTVTMDQTSATGIVSVGSLTIGGKEGSQTLEVASSCSQSAELAASGGIGIGSAATLTMTNGDSCANNVALSGAINDDGVLDVEDARGGARSIEGNLVDTDRLFLAAGAALHVTGSYTQTHVGRLRDYIAGASSFGSLSVSGTATLEEATLVLVQTAPFHALLGESFATLSSASLTGAFGEESDDQIGSTGLYYKATYSATGVTLLVTRDSPTVATGVASLVTPGSASVAGTVNPDGREVSGCKFEYGKTTSYGSSVPCSASPGSGESPVAVSASLTSLAANTTYHYRVVAANAGGTSYGGDETFKTLAGVAGCTDYWANTAGGSWFTGGDWSTGSSPHSGESACIVANGTYTVTMEQTSTTGTVGVQSLEVGAAGGSQTLVVASTCSQDAELAAGAGISIGSTATLTMTNGDSCANSVTLAGAVSDSGVLDVEAAQGGARSITGDLTDAARVFLAAGTALHVTGDYTQTHVGRLRDYIASASSFGSLSVSGAATLEGALALFPTASFHASLGESFAIIGSASLTGAFTEETGDGIGSGLYYKPAYSATGVALVVTRATLVLSKASGLSGATVKLSGSGYLPGDTLTPAFTADGGEKTVFPGVAANANGEVETEITIPVLAAEGAGSIGLTSTTTGVALTKAFTVI
ncbi:MAG TPA: S53 family peptidase [Solirubrobacteraceae bacterium]|nr:S53 family peptidase [Solirubrobacteraceae bacterium]